MALRVIGIDHGSKESLVKDCGAEVFLDITKFDGKTLAEEVKKVTGGKEFPLRVNRMCN
jgi:propanol-preferring alcohol dehydrogenase